MQYRIFLYVVVYLCLIVFAPTASGSNNNEGSLPKPLGKPLTSEEMTEAIGKIKDSQKNIDAISASVSQTKKNPLLNKEITTEGTIVLKKPNLLHWDIARPERLTTIADGRILWIYHPDSKEAQRFVIAEQLMAKQTMEFFSSTMNMSVEEMGKKFEIAAYRPDKNLILEMKPKSSITAKYLAAIYVWYKEDKAVPYKFEVIGKKGNSTVTEFQNIVLNPSIKEDIFRFVLPSDVTITNADEGRGY